MERSHDEMILRLPGTASEKQWLTDHLEALSVRERIVLSAAMAREPPRDMAGAVNCLLTLDEYFFLPQAGGQVYLLGPGFHKGDGGEGPLPPGQQAATENLVGDLCAGDVILHPVSDLLFGWTGWFDGLGLAFRLFLQLLA